MKNLTVSDNSILFSKYGELIRITPCGDNAIRFQAFPGGSVIKEDYTLMPKKSVPVITENERSVCMQCSGLKVSLEDNGKVTFYYNGEKIIEEKPDKQQNTLEQ